MLFLLLISLLIFSTSCTTPVTGVTQTNAEEWDYFKATLKASDFSFCEYKKNINIQVPIKKGILVWNNNSLNIVYEGIFREAIRTVWQPITNELEINGDGVVVGKRGIAYTIDFVTKTDSFGGVINTYRYKIPDSESFGAAFEYLHTKDHLEKIERVFIPPEDDSTVQRIWVINKVKWDNANPTLIPGKFSIVLRLNGTVQLSEYEKNDIFVLYSYDVSDNSLKKEFVINSHNEGFLPEIFFFSKDFKEPAAIGTLRNDIDEYSLSSKLPSAKEKIIYRNIFTNPIKDIDIFESVNGIHSLTTQQIPGNKTLFLTWLIQSAKKTNPEIQFLPLNIDDLKEKKENESENKTTFPQKKGKKKKKKIALIAKNIAKEIEFTSKVITFPLSYVPNNLDFAIIGKKGEPYLTWWGGTENSHALLVTSVNQLISSKKISGAKPKIIALTPSEDLGIPLTFAPTATNSTAILLAFYRKNIDDNKPKQTKVNFCAISDQQFMEITK